MRVFILLLLVVGLILLATQNGALQALVVFGYQTLALPLAVWMAAAIAAGLLTSALLQLLNARPSLSRSRQGETQELPRRDVVPRSLRDRIPEPEEYPRTSEGERITDRPRSTQSPGRDRTTSDWETPLSSNSDWGDVEASPRPNRQPPPRTDFFQKPVRPSPPASASPASDRDEDSPVNNRVYDAPYRVVNPPMPEPPEPPEPLEKEGTWVDEEDYESDLRKEYGDRG
jgi:hypothetical protein